MATTFPTDSATQEPASKNTELPQSDVLVLDSQTLKDLEIFESETLGETLFDLCNHTRNWKGADALRERMKKPFSTADKIYAVQESLAFIQERRHAFDHLPSFITTELVESYMTRSLPLITTKNVVEFTYSLLEIRFGDYGRYTWIMRGVEATSSFIRALRVIVNDPELASPHGELAPILDEMRAILNHPGFSLITEKKVWSMGPWKILHIDQMLRMFEKSALGRLLALTYEIDALLSMADATRIHGFIMPEVTEGALSVKAEGVVHPLVENAVANPVELDQQRRLLFLTGPNMAGKTTYLRSCAIALYLAHLGMGVPATRFSFVPAQRLFSSITLADNLRIGVSFFRAEGLRVKAIAQAVADGYRVIALMDEPFKGTNVKDAFDASSAILESFANKHGSLFMFSSHLIELSEQMLSLAQVDCRNFEAGEDDGPLRFDYVMHKGVSSQRLGMRVLKEEGIFELLDIDSRNKITSRQSIS